MRVLVVDDSVAFRTEIKKALGTEPGVEVVGSASNGKIALQMIEQKAVELMILDLNMPEMDGLAVLQHLAEHRLAGLKVIVFASGTSRSAKETIRALSLGADDFVLKPVATPESNLSGADLIAQELLPKVRQFMHRPVEVTPAKLAPARQVAFADRPGRPAEALVIASSTGGPAALHTIFSGLAGITVSAPIFLAQHMPPLFTQHLADRLASVSGKVCAEAKHNERVESGRVYVAPGDFHMRLIRDGVDVRIVLDQSPKLWSVRPAADHLFTSAAAIYGHTLAAVVLTGMGEDGALGALEVRKAGGRVLIQDEASSIVWGMPGAVFARGGHDAVLDLNAIAPALTRLLRTEGRAA